MAYLWRMTHPFSAYRSQNKLTLAGLGERVGLTKSAVCDVEAGRRRVSPEKAKEIEAATGIPRHVLRPDLWEAPADAQPEQAA
jgi:DNA-binding transcriptional regulator YdaS (Cro superfamily)